MPNVVPLRDHLERIIPTSQRLVEPIGHDEFCSVLESGKFDAFTEIHGVQMIHLPRAILICNGDKCSMVRQRGTNMSGFFAAAMAFASTAQTIANQLIA